MSIAAALLDEVNPRKPAFFYEFYLTLWGGLTMGFDLYQTITDRIIAELEKGTVPWQKPWNCSSGAISHVTGKPYSVLNQLMLPQSGEYVTFKQALAEGHPVRKGEKSHMVFFFKMVETQDRDSGEITAVPFLRYYPVFHISQCEGMKPRFVVSVQQENQLKPDEKAEQIISDYIRRSGVKLVVRRAARHITSPTKTKSSCPNCVSTLLLPNTTPPSLMSASIPRVIPPD